MHSNEPAESIYNNFINQIKGYAIFTIDTQGIINTWNIGAEKLKGYTEAEVLGKFYGMLSPDEYQAAHKPQQELEQALKYGIFEAKDWRKRKDGSLFWATLTLTPIYSQKGEHIGFTKITGDITREKELEDQLVHRQQDALNRKNDELQKINLDLDNFIYTASHDLKAPIANIEGLVDLLQQGIQEKHILDEEIDYILQHIRSSILRFRNTVNDLTEISRLQKNITESTAEEILNIPDMYEDIIADFDVLAKNHECQIDTEFKVKLLQFSRKNFRSILYNLISNAIKYHSPDRQCQIQVQTYLQEPYVVLTVKDNGLGLNEKNQEQLFTMFKRFHNHVEGTGIGLYITKRMVENAGGKIEVQSTEEQGAEFKVYFEAKM